MAYSRKKTNKAGAVFYEIEVSRGRGLSPLTTRWYVPAGWSAKAIARELAKQEADFERRVRSGEIQSRAEMKAQQEADAEAAARIETVKQYGEKVFMPSKKLTCSENTRAYYQFALDGHIYPAIGSVKLPEVTPAQLSALLLSMQEQGFSFSTIKGVYATLSQLFKMAYMADVIDRNPVDKIQRPRQSKDGEEVKADGYPAFTAEELQKILSCLDQEPAIWRAYIRLMVDTGMRRGEVCGLQWQFVDFDRNQITVAGNLCYTKERGIYLTTPKNGKTRTLDIPADVMQLLRDLEAQQKEERKKASGKVVDIKNTRSKTISPYVFHQPGTPHPMHPTSPTRYFKKFSDKYGIPDFHPHKLRHSFASLAITGGADIASVAQVLGHSNKATTLRMYTHADQESMKRASSIFWEARQKKEKAKDETG